jgi:hypothetical protein
MTSCLNREMENLHTPRLCIDGRAAQDLGPRGLIAQEVIDQLVAGMGEGNASSEWIEKKRTVLLTHPKQVFTGQLKRYDTKIKVGRTPIYWVWEKNFAKTANISTFHRFRPIDKLNPSLPIPTITTILPALGNLPFFISRRANQQYIVPSTADAKLLEKKYQIAQDQITIFRPSIRRYVHFVEPLKRAAEGFILFLVMDKKELKNLKRLTQVLMTAYPNIPHKIIKLKDSTNVTPLQWMKLLQNTKLCVYLGSQPFDWATLALESTYWNIPTLFSDANHALSELLPASPLKLSNFLVEQPKFSKMKELAAEAKSTLNEQGIFSSLAMAEQYSGLYKDQGIPKGLTAETGSCCN